MTRPRIPTSLRLRVIAAGRGRCAYCQTLTTVTGARFVIDHIVPVALGGPTWWDNLCLSCHSCNEFKGARRSGRDLQTGRLVALFHPRRQRWSRHFRWSWDGVTVVGLTPTGRATVDTLQMNHSAIVAARARWVAIGWHPPSNE